MDEIRNAIKDGLLMADEHYTPDDMADAIIEQIADANDTSMEDIANSLEMAWGIIANAYGGDWSTAPDRWRKAAEIWRDKYHQMIFQQDGDDV